MKQFLMAVCSCVSIASFAAISVPDPVTTPASEIAWDDFCGATRATSANWDAKDQTYSYKNGAFNMNNVSWQKGLTLNVGAGMIFTANGAWHGPIGGERELHVIRIFDGGTFNVNGDWEPNYTQLQVDNGGEFHFNPKSFKSDNNQWKQSWFDVYGLLDAPSGLKASGNLRMDIYTHDGSEIRLGGNVSKNGNGGATLRWRVLGGTIKATENVHFDCAALEVAANAKVTIDAAEGKTFDLTPFTIEGGASFVKTGAGAVSLPSGAAVDVHAGAALLASSGSYNLYNVAFSEGSMLRLGAANVEIADYNTSLTETGKLVLDATLVADGVTALTGPTEDFAEWAAGSINEGIGEGFEAVANGCVVKIQTAFVKKTSTWLGAGEDANWSTEENWDTGKPATGYDLAFGLTDRTTAVNDISDLTVSTLTFGSDAPGYVLNGDKTLTVLDKIVNESEATQTINLPIGLSGQVFELNTLGDVVLGALTSSGTPLVKKGVGMATFGEGFASQLTIAEGGVKVANGKKLAETAGAVTINGTLDLDGGTLSIVQPNSQVASIGDGAVLTNGTFNHSSEKPVYITNAKTGRAFMWTNGTWTIAKDATVITSGYLFEFGPDAPAATYGERRIVVDGGELRSTASDCKYVIGVDNDFAKPGVIELKNGALLKTTVASEFHIGARNSGTGSSMKAKGVVIANDSTIELPDQLRILNEKNESNSSGILAMTNSTLKLTNTSKIHELNATGKPWTDAQMILNHTEASFGQLLANARVGSGMSAGKMVGVLTLDGATLKPIKQTDKFIYNSEAATKTIELLTDGATVDTAYDVTIPAIIYGVGGLTKKGAGTLTLSAANIYTGATTVEEGKLILTGSVAGPLEIGANGTLAVTTKDGAVLAGGASSLNFAEGAKIAIDLTGVAEQESYPFLRLPTGAKMTGTPTVEVVGATHQKWAVVTRKTEDGVVCSIVQQGGFVITVY